MAREPSAEEILRAVEQHVSRHGISARLTSPGTADLSWQSLLDCRIVRSIETRDERSMKDKGRRADLAERPTYTDLAEHPVDPPADPDTSQRLELVLLGSLDEVPCEGCEGGRKECVACRGRGGRACPEFVKCDGCGGGIDACWDCDGTGRPRPRGKPTEPRPAGAPQRVRCVRCHRPDSACPTCLGRGRTDCTVCKGAGFVECQSCKGAGRVKHVQCGGAGLFTTWTGAVISHAPEVKTVEEPAPLYLRRPRDATAKGHWHGTTLTSTTDKLPDDLAPEHRAMIAPHLSVKENEVGRRVTLRHLPLARVTAHADPDRVYFAFPSRTGIEVVERPSRQRVVHFTAIGSAAVAVAVLVLVLVATVLN
ncbi:hypothetical protein ACFOZ0_08640 [Streptomyces yaanensis]|uniref:Uncharacterized protein n=1 Tax=Streptomyces yaanensis TaxID=1142239 RepID=A0ABV7SAF2_9ACTN|nr:hypothetical protein [Streptomyces sp. CGMCC 4.7035]WNC02822.1 hypothetical protein Q2K21_34900 [Streptomyces sp. CGMCC 4.7035]